jgi:hypothetical protein
VDDEPLPVEPSASGGRPHPHVHVAIDRHVQIEDLIPEAQPPIVLGTKARPAKGSGQIMYRAILRLVIVAAIAATTLLMYGGIAEAGLRINTN